MKSSFGATSAEFVSNSRNPGRKAGLATGMVRPGSLLATAGTENTEEVRDAVGRVCAVRDCVIKEEAAIRAGVRMHANRRLDDSSGLSFVKNLSLHCVLCGSAFSLNSPT